MSDANIKIHRVSRIGQLFAAILVEERDSLTLVDTNFAGSANGIATAIEATGKPLKRILITHAHADHVGSLDALAERYPKAEVVASERTAALLAGDRSLRLGEEGINLRGGYMATKTRPSRLVADDDVLDGFRAVFTPGHAVGHVAYLHDASGTFFVGDALVSVGGLHVTGVFRLRFPFPYFATADRLAALASAKRIAALAPRSVHPIHGRAIDAPAYELSRAIKEAETAFAR